VSENAGVQRKTSDSVRNCEVHRKGKTAYAPWTDYRHQYDEKFFGEEFTEREKKEIKRRLKELGYF